MAELMDKELEQVDGGIEVQEFVFASNDGIEFTETASAEDKMLPKPVDPV